MRNLTLAILLICIVSGCSRKTYRLWADRDAQCLIKSRQFCDQWEIPDRCVEPPVNSRMRDFNHPDCPCKRPGDDPAAAKYMNCSYCYRGSKYWDQFSPNSPIEQLHWSEYLPLDEEGECKVDRQLAVDLALLHNRGYQTQYEQLYLNALNLSLNRYDFHSRWFGGNDTSFDAQGDGAAASRLLSTSNDLGFTRDFVGGGQFLTNIANAFVWQLGGGPNTNAVSTNLIFTLTQPLLRGAFRHVRMENLTQAERTLLYGVRDFVRFRRQFYLDTVEQYLNLLTIVQGLKNTRANVNALESNLRETEELLLRELASPLQVDQVLQDYQQGRLNLLSAEQGLQDTLDAFKFSLGLPPEAPILLDESILETFELNDPKLDALRSEVDETYAQLRKYLPPEKAPQAVLEKVAADIITAIEQTQELLPTITDELDRWKTKMDAESKDELLDTDSRLDLMQQRKLYDRITETLEELETELETDASDAEELADDIENVDEIENWRGLQELIGGRLQNRITTLFVLQNQIRLFLIELRPFDIDIDFAVENAIANRLDLRNQRGIVTDAFRQVEIAADALQSDLNVSATANLATDPAQNNSIRFDSSAASYQMSVQFDGPLDRFAERNAYRASQIAYQNARRDYMELEDAVKNTLRSEVRSLKINRLNFQIIRQQLIAATRRVDEAQINLRAPTGDNISTSRTRDLLEALQALLDTRNGLIQSWIDYETSRITLFVEMEMLYLDDNGVWVNERYNPRQNQDAVDQSDELDVDGPRLEFEDELEDDSSETSSEDGVVDGPKVDLEFFQDIPDRPGFEGQ